MEGCPPGGDCAPGEGDPSKSDNPPASWTPNPAGQQAQGKSVSSGDDVSQAAHQSPELKKKVSSAVSEEHASSTLQGTTFDEKSLLSQSVHSFDHKQCAMLFRRYVSRTAAGRGRAVLEGVGLPQEDIQMCFSKALQNEEEAIQFGLMKWRDGSGGSTTWAVLIEAMKYAQIGTQHIKAMKDELLKGLPSSPLPQSVSAEGSQTVSMRGASTVSTSGMAMAVNTSPDVSVLSLESLKMDILSCDVNVFESQKHPADAIRSFYFNAYNHLIRILSTHCSAIKSVALSAVRTKQVSATEVEVKKARDLRALFECLEVDKKWNDLEFLSITIMSLPVEASKEKGAAQLVLGQYKSYLTHYTKAVSIKEGKSALSFLQRQRGREERMVVTEITVDKEIDEYTCHDLLDLWKLYLIETLEIPEDRIEYRLARAGNSTTLVFMITRIYAEGIQKKLSKPAAVWVMKELDILRVYIAGVVSVDLREVLPNVLLASIREGLELGVDFVSLTKVIPPLMCSLLDQVPQETQPDIQPYSAGPAEQSVPEPVVEAASSASVVKDLLVAAAEGRLHEVQSLLDGGRCRVNDEDEEGFTAILIAALNGHLTVLRTLVEQYGGNVLHRMKGGFNAFHLCADGGHVGVAQYLAPKMGVHRFDLTDAKDTALHVAAGNGQLPMVEHLVKSARFDVKDKNKYGATPFLVATARGHVEVAGFLLDNGSSILERADDGFNAFHLSAACGHVDVAQYLSPMMGVHVFDLTDAKSTALHISAINGHLPMVEHLIKSAGFDVKDKNKIGQTPFLVAAAMGHVEVARFLLDNGSSILERADGGFNAFHLSAEGGHVGVAQYLAPMMGVHMFDLTDEKETALHRAATNEHLPMVKHLVKSAGFDVKAKNENGGTPFLIAAEMGHIEVAGFLLDNGSSILERSNEGQNAFLLCAMKGHLPVAKYLAPKMEGHLFDSDDDGHTALHLAAYFGQMSMVKYLVRSCGFDVKARNKGGYNAFHLSAERGHVGIAQYLAPVMGVHMFDLTDAKETALHRAAVNGHLPMVEHLVKSAGFHVNDKNKYGATPFLRAAARGHGEVADFLLNNGSSILERTDGGLNAFHMSAWGGHIDVAQYLAPMMGGQVFDLTDEKETALHIAVENGHLPMVEHLVKSARFDVKDKNKNGGTPFLIAAEMGHVEVAGFLLDNGSSILEQADKGRNAFLLCAIKGHLAVAKYLAPKMEGHLFDSDDDGHTALHLAAYFGQLPMVEHLVRSCGFDVKARDKWGNTPHLRAVKKGHADIARFLLASGSVFNERNSDGDSALQIAVRRGHLDVVKVLIQAYRDLHMESEIDQYYMDLADDHHHEHVVGYLSSEFPSLKRKVPVPQPTMYPNVWSISGPTYPDY